MHSVAQYKAKILESFARYKVHNGTRYYCRLESLAGQLGATSKLPNVKTALTELEATGELKIFTRDGVWWVEALN